MDVWEFSYSIIKLKSCVMCIKEGDTTVTENMEFGDLVGRMMSGELTHGGRNTTRGPWI